MFPNLRAEMARKGLDGVKISARIGCTPKTFSNKMIGKTEFTRGEIFNIKRLFFPDLSIEYLFKQENKQNTA